VKHILGLLTLLLVGLSQPLYAEFEDRWYDDVTQTVFEDTDKIDIIIGETQKGEIALIEARWNFNVTFKFAIKHITKIEITDILLESSPGLAEFGTKFPTNLALLKMAPEANISELTLSFQDIKIVHLKGFPYSEIVLMVKIKTAEGKHYFTVKRLKVHA